MPGCVRLALLATEETDRRSWRSCSAIFRPCLQAYVPVVRYANSRQKKTFCREFLKKRATVEGTVLKTALFVSKSHQYSDSLSRILISRNAGNLTVKVVPSISLE